MTIAYFMTTGMAYLLIKSINETAQSAQHAQRAEILGEHTAMLIHESPLCNLQTREGEGGSCSSGPGKHSGLMSQCWQAWVRSANCHGVMAISYLAHVCISEVCQHL